jgi:ABC-type multidrug transport system fused ATPase/permease subunit
MVIGVLFEMIGLGALIPALGLMLNPEIINNYPYLGSFFAHLGNPSKLQIVLYGLILLILIYTIKASFLIYLSWRQSKFSADLSADLANQLFIGYLRLPYSFHLEKNSAELLRNIQSEVGQFTFISQSVIALSVEISIVIGVALMLIIVEPIGALIITTFLTLSVYIFHILTKKRLLSWGEQRQKHIGLANLHLLQGLGGVKDVKVLAREDHFLNEFRVHNYSNAKIQTKVSTLGLVPRLYLELLAVIGLVGLIIIMVIQKKPLELLLPTMGVFAAAAFRMIPSANRIMTSIQGIRYARPVVELLYYEIELIRSEISCVQTTDKIEFKYKLELKDLSFKYFGADKKALDNISLTLLKGQTIGIIGPSGSGKSTLVDVILGLLNPVTGEVLSDEKNINTNIRSWQSQIGYVPQSIYLTDDTLRNNIAFGIPSNQINEASVLNALKAAQLEEFVKSLPRGLDTFVGERGVRLSGGQRQRIGIARALYNNPPFLLLDEATSALDNSTEGEVMAEVMSMKGKKTILIVAHRLTTVSKCDTIYRFSSGKIIEEGTPESVLKH